MALDKRQSQTDILQLLRGRVEMTRADIAAELGLSMPTVINNVNLMVQNGILEECGSEQSTGGRRARRIRLKTDAAYAVGINVAVHHVSMALTDLQGEILENVREEMIFSDTLDWYRELGSRLRNFVDRCGIPGDKILGVGISFPGIIDEAGSEVIRSHIFGLSHMSTDRFRRFIPWPLTIGARQGQLPLCLSEHFRRRFHHGERQDLYRRYPAGGRDRTHDPGSRRPQMLLRQERMRGSVSVLHAAAEYPADAGADPEGTDGSVL